MFCEKCGHELKDEDLFCEKCGKQVFVVANAKEHSYENNKKKVIGVIIVIIVLIISAILVMGKSGSDTKQIATENNIDTVETTEISTSTEVKSEKTIEPEAVKVGTVEQLYESDEYSGKKIEITGLVNFEDPYEGVLKMYGSYSDIEAFLVAAPGYDMPFNDCMTVIGVMTKDEYGTVCIHVEYAEEHGEKLEF